MIDARDSHVVTTVERGDLTRRRLAYGWPPYVELWRRDVCHRFGSMTEPVAFFPLLLWAIVSTPLVLTAAMLLWITARPLRFVAAAGAAAALLV